MLMLHDALLIALVCGLCSLDLIAAFQVLLSRPLLTGALTGLALGDTAAGVSAGVVMELLWLQHIEVGSVVPPDFTLSSCLATALAILAHRAHPAVSWEASMAAALLVTLPTAWIGGISHLWQRRRQAALAAWAEARLEAGDESALAKAVGISLSLTFVLAFLLALLGVAALTGLLARMLGAASPGVLKALESIYWLSLLLGFAVLIDLFWDRRGFRIFGPSFAAAALGLYVAGIGAGLVLALAGVAGVAVAWWFRPGNDAEPELGP